MKESRIYSFLAFLLLLATSLVGLSSTSFVSASQTDRVNACKEPINVKHYTTNTSYNKFMFITTSYNAISGFYQLGGSSTSTDKGVNWACNHYRSNGDFIGAGIIFILRNVTVGDKIPTYSGSSYKYRTYSFNTDVDASSGSTSTATLGGLVHQNSDEYTASNYAIHIGFCKTYNACAPGSGTGNASVNQSAAKAGADGIISRSGNDDIKVKRMINGTNYTQASFGLWSEPYIGFGSWPTVTINNDTLKTAVDNGSVTWTPISSGSRTGTVTLYIQRCWSGDGSSMGSSDTCEAGKVYLITKLKPKSNPWTAEFEGKISTSVSSDATAVTENGAVIYYTDSSTPEASFVGKHRRKDTNNPPSSASGSWKSTTTNKSGTPSLSNTNWSDVDSYSKKASLSNPGDSQKICYKFGYYQYRKSNDEGTDSSLSDWKDKESCVTFKRYNYTHTFTGSVSGSATVNGTAMTMGATNKVDFDKATVSFTDKVCRTDTIRPDKFNSNWYVYNAAASSISSSNQIKHGTDALAKKNVSGDCVTYTDNRGTVNLGFGNNYFYNTLGYHASITDAGAKSDWKTPSAWVNIYRYSWYDVEGKVEVDSNATNRSGTYWIDANTANIQFKHYLKRNTTVAVQTKYKTTKDPNPGTDFVTKDAYTPLSTMNVNNAWYNQYNSPSNGRKAVNVAKDTGTTYCQTLYYYAKVREDSNDHKSETNTSGCISLKRYKTTFTGNTKVYVNGNSTDNRDGDTIVVSTADKYPVKVPVTFTHTVTRSGSDPDGSPTKKASSIATNIFDGTDTKGYRTNDPHGTARAAAATIGLNPSESDSYSDTFTVNVYPEQEIQLCQQMTYVNEVQGTESTGSTTGNKACIKIKMGKDTCFEQEFSIKDAKNYMRVQIRKKNSSDVKVISSGIKYQGSTEIETWAKPGDQIRFDYDACAGGELARQYAFSNVTTSYDISAEGKKTNESLEVEKKNGYLFGDALSSSPYTATTKNLGSSNATVGNGPFTIDNKPFYKTSTTSPHGTGSIYSCDAFGTTGRESDHYRISNYISGITEERFKDNCNSDDYGFQSELGVTFKQVTSWTDTQYSGGSVVAGHNGAAASITASVKVPYNYKTTITTSGDGGYILPGNPHTEKIKLNVNPRKNTPVGRDEYATVTKQSKYKLIEINVGSGNSTPADTFNNLVNNNKYFYDTTGNIDFNHWRDGLPVCKSFGCNIIKSGETRFNPANNVDGGQTIPGTEYELTIPYNAEPGTKICYIAAIWPSDSHNLPNADDLTVEQNAAGLNPKGTYWHVSGATCYTVAKRPSVNILGGDTYAQGHITARTQKYPKDNAGSNPRIYGSWTEYSAISGMGLKGFASGASLWGGSKLIADVSIGSNIQTLNCSFSSYTFANSKCGSGKMGSMAIDTTTSSNPETIANQMITRYTRSDNTGKMHVTGAGPFLVEDAGVCSYDDDSGTYVEHYTSPQSTFSCIGDTGAKYTHVDNTGNQVAYIPNVSGYCMGKGDTYNSRTSIIHSDGTLVVGANMAYGSNVRTSWNQERTPSGLCWEDSYNSISEIPQSILIAKKIIIKDYVTYLDTWLIADEIITCDPVAGWNNDVSISSINTQNCNQQLTINGPVMAKNLKLYRTYGTGFHSGYNRLASPAEIFTMGPEVYLWSYNQAQRYSQATTTYARELAPRY